MRKIRCYRNSFYGVIFLLVTIALFSLFNIEIGTISGVKPPSLTRTISFFLLALLVFILSRIFCVNPKVYKYLDCDEIFDEQEVKYGICPICSGALMDIKEYYNKN